MPHRHLLRDGQADAVACSFVAAMQALERFEQFRRICHVEANATVTDVQMQPVALALALSIAGSVPAQEPALRRIARHWPIIVQACI